jgi:anionic cell wall polymer biosynthesis LytR-Cps2A-Psr (LCP) family protein
VLINGVEAEVFVRYRDIASLESNNERIRRQKTFLIAFANTVLQKTKADLSIPVKLFQEISDEIVTSLSVSDISYLASKAVNCTISMDNLTVIQGEVKSDGTYAAFYPDETALFELILKTFYYKK